MNDSAEFVPHDFSHLEAEEKKSSKKSLKAFANIMLKFFLVFLIVGLLGGAGYYISTHKPSMVQDVLLTLDRFGITETGKEEKARQAAINRLKDITYEEKQVLLQKTVFLGATSEMVTLALGQPKEKFRAPANASFPEGVVYIYHFPKDARPTLLRFVDNKLTVAEKRSNIDLK